MAKAPDKVESTKLPRNINGEKSLKRKVLIIFLRSIRCILT